MLISGMSLVVPEKEGIASRSFQGLPPLYAGLHGLGFRKGGK